MVYRSLPEVDERISPFQGFSGKGLEKDRLVNGKFQIALEMFMESVHQQCLMIYLQNMNKEDLKWKSLQLMI